MLKSSSLTLETKGNLPEKIYLVDNFLTPSECDLLIELAAPLLAPSTTVIDGVRQPNPWRTSYSAYLRINHELIDQIYEKAAEMLNTEAVFFEDLQCTSYKTSQEFRAHYDAFNTGNSEEILRYGQRKSTLLIYLNDDFDGGETDFPLLKARIPPKKGRAIIWDNMLTSSLRDEESLHAGLPVTNGQKYVCNLWLRDKVQERNARKHH